MKNYLQLTRHTGNTTLFLAVEMSLVSALRGIPLHMHAEGLRGTGKTTIMRSIKQILPKITRIKGCL
ncbi:MAG TPA: magnesium chelatase, partial [Peptococcaceae bacterium]|nr:magnesium chelatase [Peptococcaceae bacterium]